MSFIARSVCDLIGNTPLLELCRIEEKYGLKARLLVKTESKNPGGSAKDRVALAMIDEAERTGKLKPGGTIIEPTSGNTGIGICAIAAARGYHAVIVMPDTMSIERRQLMAAYGAEVVLTPGEEGMAGSIRRAGQIQKSIAGSFIPGQFDNPENPAAHYRTTGPEIFRDTDGQIAAFVAGAGTGGTITGVGRYLKERDPHVKIVAVEPENSAVLSGKPAGPHGLQGIGAGFIPKVLDTSLIDEIIPVSDRDACDTAHTLARCEGVLAGISGGAALFAGIALARREEVCEKNVVVLLPDTGERYLSSLYAL